MPLWSRPCFLVSIIVRVWWMLMAARVMCTRNEWPQVPLGLWGLEILGLVAPEDRCLRLLSLCLLFS